jgi:hypothetical protein
MAKSYPQTRLNIFGDARSRTKIATPLNLLGSVSHRPAMGDSLAGNMARKISRKKPLDSSFYAYSEQQTSLSVSKTIF